MTSLIIAFFLGFGLSFVGSLPPGAISMATVEAAVHKGLRTATGLAFGAALVEFFQAAIAVKFSSWIMQNPAVEQAFSWATVPVFLGIGLYYFLKKEKNKPGQEEESGPIPRKTGNQGVGSGIVLSALNMLAIPYWVFYAATLSAMGWLEIGSWSPILLFSAGVFGGTFLALMGYAKLGRYAATKSNKFSKVASSLVGATFVLLAIGQLVNLLG